MHTKSSLLGWMKAQHSSMPSQVYSHESASPSSDRILDKATNATKLTPISALPADVLIEIISIISRPRVHRHDYVKRLHTLAQVCSTWANIILQTPVLWSLVRFDALFGGTGWLTALRRSQPCRIEVECRLDPWGSPEPFWSTIKTHSHRWTSLMIDAPEGGERFEFAGVHAPFLEELSIYMSGEQLDVGGANFPNVSALALINVGLQDWASGLLSGLRSLYLHLGHTLVHPPSLEQFLDILAASPHLEDLRIHAMDSAVDSASIRWPLILLPELRNITIGNLPAIAVDAILQSIHAAQCSVLSSAANLMSS
ncbi:hypothetical protein FRB95_010952 [Tulasnella sp. JGI-2019a]|nr:hypothetical protein FRB95_010952 [Tulasnella sp. JGI-2019a]